MPIFSGGGDADRRIVEIYARLQSDEARLDKIETDLKRSKVDAGLLGDGSGSAGKYAIWSSDAELAASALTSESGSTVTIDGHLRPLTDNNRDFGDTSHAWANTWATLTHTDELHDSGAGFIKAFTNLRADSDGGQDLGTGAVKFGKVWTDELDFLTGTNGVFYKTGSGNPNGSQSGDIGAVYVDRSGAASMIFWVKESNTPDVQHGWVAYGAAGAGGANTTLSNLTSPTAINQHLIPGTDDTFDLGSSGPKFWRILYINRLIGNALGAGKIEVDSELMPQDLSWSLGDSTHRWTNLYLAQQGTGRLYFSQTGTTPSISAGSTDPAGGTIIADTGSIYLRKGAGAGLSLYVKENDDGAGTGWTAMNPSGGAAPGSNTQVIFNTSGAFDADADLTWDKTNNVLTIAGASGSLGTSGASSTIASRGTFLAEKGTAGNPTYTFRIDTGTGIRHGDSTNSMRFCTNGSDRWTIDANGNLITATQNTVDIGANGVTEPRNIYAGTSIFANTAGVGGTAGVHTPYIDGSGVSVVFGDSQEPDGDGTRNSGASGARWASVYGNAFRFATFVGVFTWAGDPNTHVTASPGSICLDSSGATIWEKSTGTATSSGWTVVTGGGGTPPGSDTQVVFNDGGSFGADNAFTWDKTNNVLGVAGSGATDNGVIGTTGANSYIVSAGTFRAPAGSAGAPSYTFSAGSRGTGIRKDTTEELLLCSNAADRWKVDSGGHFRGVLTNTYDIGPGGIGAPRNITAATSVKTPYVGTQLIDSNTGHSSPVVFGDTLEPDFDISRNCGSAGKAWASVYSAAFRFTTFVGVFNWPGDPNTHVTASPGSICLDSSGAQIWEKSSGVATATGWTVFGGSGANLQLSNLTGTTAVPVDLLPDASVNARLLGSVSKIWGQSWINTVNTNNIGTLTGGGTLRLLNDVIANGGGGTDLGTAANYFGSTYSANLAVTNIVPQASPGYIGIGSGSAPVYIIFGGVARQLSITPTATPLYVV